MVVFIFREYIMYVYIIYVYMSNPYTYVQSIYIWIMLVGNYSVNKNFTNTARHTKSKPSICDLCHM